MSLPDDLAEYDSVGDDPLYVDVGCITMDFEKKEIYIFNTTHFFVYKKHKKIILVIFIYFFLIFNSISYIYR